MANRSADLADLLTAAAQDFGGQISVADLRGLCTQVPGLALRAEQQYHHGAYCLYAKAHGQQPLCAKNKQRSLARAEAGTAFAGCCPFGVWEHVEPVSHDGSLVAVLYLGGFRQRRALVVHGTAAPALPVLDREHRLAVQRAASLVREWILLRLRAWLRAGNAWQQQRPSAWYLEGINRLIRERFHLRLTRLDVARELGINPDHLTRLLRQGRGCGFSELLQRERLNRARALLRTGTRSVAEVARACGYADPNYFSAAFTRREGCSPRAFARG